MPRCLSHDGGLTCRVEPRRAQDDGERDVARTARLTRVSRNRRPSCSGNFNKYEDKIIVLVRTPLVSTRISRQDGGDVVDRTAHRVELPVDERSK